MARNADEGELARIAAEVSVQRLAEVRAIALATGKAGDLVGACPLCDDVEGLAVSGIPPNRGGVHYEEFLWQRSDGSTTLRSARVRCRSFGRPASRWRRWPGIWV